MSNAAQGRAEMVATGAQANRIEGCLPIAQEGALKVLATIREHGPQFRATEAARSNSQVAIRSVES